MQTTHFQKFFNLSALLFLTAILGVFCTICFGISMNSLQEIAYLTFIYRFISIIFWFSLLTSLVSFLIFIFLISHEIKNRQKKDNLSNLWKSIYQTYTMRTFLKQSEQSETVTAIEQVKVTSYNPINKYFNRAVQKAIVDIRENKTTLLIRIPKTQQATKILKDMEVLISEEIANRNPDYYFSRPERNGKWLNFIGTKRK
ncbi:membrane protein [Streptococcus equi subsp. zooepidemicus]|uniref:hypothetical protein n=2 Tax=Streptococcus equi TaxID=1336 RepID=UPI000DA2EDA1|nr:membrane protein [Streptococcus equi subsp. zooepidemicus]VED86296.1 membrane protein [Streptococcus equi subsp. equi]HEL1218820.1 hypothetical protein [Streptococcus equi subsp. zooepidemicus]